MGPNPIWKALCPGCLSKNVAGGAKYGQEKLCFPDHARCRGDYGDRLPRIVHEQLLTGLVFLSHYRINRPQPGAVEFTKPAVLIPIGMGGPVLLPKKSKGHPFSF